MDLLAERRLQHAVLALLQQAGVRSAHDCAEGGLALALAECAIGDGEHPMGVEVELSDDMAPVPLLFGESQGRVVVSCDPDDSDDVMRLARRHGVPCRTIGEVGAPGGRFRIKAGASGVDVDLEALVERHASAIPRIMDRTIETDATDPDATP